MVLRAEGSLDQPREVATANNGSHTPTQHNRNTPKDSLEPVRVDIKKSHLELQQVVGQKYKPANPTNTENTASSISGQSSAESYRNLFSSNEQQQLENILGEDPFTRNDGGRMLLEGLALLKLKQDDSFLNLIGGGSNSARLNRLLKNVHNEWIPILIEGLAKGIWDTKILGSWFDKSKFFSPPNENVKKIFRYPMVLNQREYPDAGNQVLKWALENPDTSSGHAKNMAAKMVIEFQVPYGDLKPLVASNDIETIDIYFLAVQNGVKFSFPNPNLMTPPQMKTYIVLNIAVDRLGLDYSVLLEPSQEIALNKAIGEAFAKQGFGSSQIDYQRLNNLLNSTIEIKRSFLLAMAMEKVNKEKLDRNDDDVSWAKGSAVEVIPRLVKIYDAHEPHWVGDLPNDISLPNNQDPIPKKVFSLMLEGDKALSIIPDEEKEKINSSAKKSTLYFEYGAEVADLLKLKNNGRKINALEISGHGEDGRLISSLGQVILSAENFEEHEVVFRQLAPYLKDGTLIITGCEFGKTEKSHELLARLAEALECKVITGTTLQMALSYQQRVINYEKENPLKDASGAAYEVGKMEQKKLREEALSSRLDGFKMVVAYPHGEVKRVANPDRYTYESILMEYVNWRLDE